MNTSSGREVHLLAWYQPFRLLGTNSTALSDACLVKVYVKVINIAPGGLEGVYRFTYNAAGHLNAFRRSR